MRRLATRTAKRLPLCGLQVCFSCRVAHEARFPRGRARTRTEVTMETVSEILGEKGRAVHTTSPGATVFQAVEVMARHHVGALLVVNGGTPAGVISERDVM